MKTNGQIAYEAYLDSLGASFLKSTWNVLPEHIREAWEAAAKSVLGSVRPADGPPIMPPNS